MADATLFGQGFRVSGKYSVNIRIGFSRRVYRNIQRRGRIFEIPFRSGACI